MTTAARDASLLVLFFPHEGFRCLLPIFLRLGETTQRVTHACDGSNAFVVGRLQDCIVRIRSHGLGAIFPFFNYPAATGTRKNEHNPFK